MTKNRERSETGLESRIEDLILTLARENEALREELRQTRTAFAFWAEAAVASCRKLEIESGRPGRQRWNHQTMITELVQLAESLRAENPPSRALYSSELDRDGTDDLRCA